MKSKYLFVGMSMVAAFFLGVLLFSTCNPISNKCYAESGKGEVAKNAQVKNLNPQDFKQSLDTGQYKLIDIRTADEFNSGNITGAQNIDFYKSREFSNYLDRLDKSGKYLIYCRSGNRSSQALGMMKAKGFENVSDLDGGINSWVASGLPLN